jgi:predicted extracellular nuclease
LKGEKVIRRSLAAVVVLMVVILVASCASDEANPQGSGTNPTASTITVTVFGNTATITWTQCPDDDFSSYVLYRSKSSGIASNPSSAVIVATVTDLATLTYSDGSLDWNTPYYYALQTVDSSLLTSWSNEATITTPDSSGSGGDALSCYQIQGQADESPYNGQDVTVTGIVTVGGDEYYAGSGSAQYAVIEDASGGEWSGLLLYGYDGIFNGLERGDSVVVSGYISEYDMSGVWANTVTELMVQSVDFNEAGHTIPAPEELSTGDMSQEKWEGVLAALSDVTVTNEDMGHGDWLVDDGSGDAMVDDMGIYGYTVSLGDVFSEIIGVVLYSFDDYKLEPRNEDDITE